ncbi:GDSL-type esterase/lipase family protein [Streptomyces sp. H39-S7]|uniref:GDSL-type esterase/lipase family protein n=1 Tax=Streptomyces sp. H39-S7 TaxID=3004357 RepID=UPI0022B012C1|nr:GDSL-type esterase/lipase family protein [Streptomyces sp. H39-S7]MCZ4126195.1 GDSL-type esterase/lipase family protein [Streptomyces sp. H39-S7]
MSVKLSVGHRRFSGWLFSRWRSGTTAVLVAAALLAGLLIVVPGAAPAIAAPLGQTPLITYNMQGESAGSASKWTNEVQEYARSTEIVLLQEVGPQGPSGATLEVPITTPEGVIVQHRTWTPGGSSRGGSYHVYFAQTDRNGGTNTGGRVNIAIITRNAPDEVRVVANPIQAGRTALGVRFGTQWYFTVHGLSPGGGDSNSLLEAIDSSVDRWTPGGVWTAGGDFNVDPRVLQNRPLFPMGATVYSSGQATHQDGGEYDYYVTSDRSSSNFRAVRQDGASSDHYAVSLGGLAAAADPPDFKVMSIGDNLTDDYVKNGFLTTLGLGMVAILSLVSRSPSVEFVGSQSDGTTGSPHYEGGAGENISAITKRSETAVPTYRPNVVVVQAGMQDMKDGTTDGAGDRLAKLLANIHTHDPGTVIVVATLGPSTNPAVQTRITAYNAVIKATVADLRAMSRPVQLADMSPLTTGDLNADGSTTNDAGDAKMGQIYSDAIHRSLVNGWLDSTPLRILPFGDSITFGTGSSTSSSYRKTLQAELYGRGRNSDFVGSQKSGAMPQPANEGHPGWQISQLADIAPCVMRDYAPNLVLLHIGTNDINAGLDLGNAPNRLQHLIEDLNSKVPGVTVLVGSLLGTTWSAASAANMKTFNTQSKLQVAALRDRGLNVKWVDMAAVTTNDMQDGLHPNDAGYAKMATVWGTAIEEVTDAGWLTAPRFVNGPSSGDEKCATPPPAPPAPPSSPRGRADYINVHPDSSVTAYLNGGIPSPLSPAPAGKSTIPWTELGYVASGVAGGAPGGQIQFADLNGDGRADYINVHPDSSVTAYLNGGIPSPLSPAPAGKSTIPWTELGYIASGVAGGAPGSHIQFADLNG